MQNPATPRPVRLAHGMVENGQSRFLPILTSTLAQEIMASGYAPQTLERIYAGRLTGGLLARAADRVVLDLPVHFALRERYEAAVGEICAAAILARRNGASSFRVLSAPVGLAAELTGAARRLREQDPETLSRLRCWGVDRDPEGNLLEQTAERAREAGLSLRLIHEDLRRRREVEAVTRREGPFHFINCVGLSQLYSGKELTNQVRFFARLLAPGGTLLLDRWNSTSEDEQTARLGIGMQSLSGVEAATLVRDAGLKVEREHPTGEGGCVLMVLRKPE